MMKVDDESKKNVIESNPLSCFCLQNSKLLFYIRELHLWQESFLCKKTFEHLKFELF